MERNPRPPQIASIVIPADDNKPLHRQRIDPPGPSYDENWNVNTCGERRLSHFYLPPTDCLLYIDGRGRPRQPANYRASLLLDVYDSTYGHRNVGGDAFITGWSDKRRADADVPDNLFVRSLLGRGRPYYLEYQVGLDLHTWHRAESTFHNWVGAHKYVRELRKQGTKAFDIRLVPTKR